MREVKSPSDQKKLENCEEINAFECEETTLSNESNPNCLNNEAYSILRLVRNFHRSVSTGPLYICSCCDQLWYEHSVFPADHLKIANPDASKYLQNIKSIDNIEWLCHTCNNQ